MNSTEDAWRCPKHPSYKIDLMKINNLKDSKEKPFFYCIKCMNSDLSFQPQDYQLIQDIINHGNKEVFPKIPQVESQDILDRLALLINENGDINIVIEKINKFFSNFREQLSSRIDNVYKKMIQIAEQIPYKKEEIIKQYNEISRIAQLQSELSNNHTNLEEKETICSKIMQESSSLIHQNTEQLISALQSYNSNLLFDNNSAISIQQSILSQIDDIELFQKSFGKFKINNAEIINTLWKGQDAYQNLNYYNNLNKQITSMDIQRNIQLNQVLNFILNNNFNYIIRIKIDKIENGSSISLGLIQDEFKDKRSGKIDNLYVNILRSQNELIVEHDSTSNKYNKNQGEKIKLSEEREIEIRLSIKQNIFQIMDYTEKKQILYFKNFNDLAVESNNLRFYLGIKKYESEIILTNASIVMNFD